MIQLLIVLLSFSGLFAEENPPPEFPQPQRELASEVNGLGVEKPIRKDSRGGYYYKMEDNKKKKAPYKGIQQPYKIGSDGSYYYSDDEKSRDVEPYKGVEQPIDSDSSGGYYYSRKKEKKEPAKNKYGPQPSRVKADGSYIYDQALDETRNTFYFRVGVYGPPQIEPVNPAGRDYEQVYGDSSSFLVNIEYDWHLAASIFLKAGIGLTSAEGAGQFSDPANAGVTPRENFTFYIIPTTASLAYKFQIWDIQYLTPYVEGGGGYFGFMETRSDGDKTKFGGAPVLLAAGGLLFSLSKFISGTELSTEYGVTQMWLDFQYKQIMGLDSRKDFSSNMITGGFAVGF